MLTDGGSALDVFHLAGISVILTRSSRFARVDDFLKMDALRRIDQSPISIRHGYSTVKMNFMVQALEDAGSMAEQQWHDTSSDGMSCAGKRWSRSLNGKAALIKWTLPMLMEFIFTRCMHRRRLRNQGQVAMTFFAPRAVRQGPVAYTQETPSRTAMTSFFCM